MVCKAKVTFSEVLFLDVDVQAACMTQLMIKNHRGTAAEGRLMEHNIKPLHQDPSG